jgi:ParB/RepB/Spo0J family partition protein
MELKEIQVELVDDVVAAREKTIQLSLMEVGQKDPIKVRPTKNDRYQLVDGRRRFLELRASGQESILALVEEMSDKEAHIQALVLNSGTPNVMGEATHIAYLMGTGLTQDEISRMCSWSGSKVSSRLKLLDLIPALQSELERGLMNVSAANALRKLPVEWQEKVLDEKKITSKLAHELLREYQSRQMGLFEMEDETPDVGVRPGLFLTADQVDLLQQGEQVEVEYQGDMVRLIVNPYSTDKADDMLEDYSFLAEDVPPYPRPRGILQTPG